MGHSLFRKWWFWTLAAFVVLIILYAAARPDSSTPAPSSAPALTSGPTAAAKTADPGVTDSFPPSSASPAPSAASVTSAPADQIPLPESDIRAYVGGLSGAGFIREITVGTDNVEITYYASFTDYNKANPKATLTAEEYRKTFDTPDAIRQILMEESTLLFHRFPGTASIDIALPYNGRTYLLSITKGSAEKFYGTDLDQITSEEQWNMQIRGPYWTRENRDRFARKFIRVSE